MAADRTPGWRRLSRLCLALVLLAALAVAHPAAPVAVAATEPATVVNALDDGRPVVRLDTDGNPLDAHDGQLLSDGGRYWLIGMAYSCGQEWPGRRTPGVVSTTCGVRAYSSPDLVTWHDEGYLIDGSAMPSIPKTACTPACWRPKAVRSGSGWTIWVNSPYQSAYEDYQVFTSPQAFTGPYSWVGQAQLGAPAGGAGQDFTLYDDPVTGAAYVASLSAGSGIYVQRLNPNRTDVSPGTTPTLVGGELAAAAAAAFPAAVTQGLTGEAPMMTRGPNGDAYVMIGVPLCGFCTTGSGLAYSAAASFDGPFPPPRTFLTDACSTQSTSLLAVASTTGGTRWLYQGDRWWESPMTVGLPPKPFAGTTGNQGPASQSFEEMAFDEDGTPSMGCHPVWTMPEDVVLGAGETTGRPPLGVACEALPRTTQTATMHVASTGDVDAVQLNVFASEAPDGPARLSIRDGTGVVLGSASVPFVPVNVPTTSGVSWSPFTVAIPMSTRLGVADYVVALTHPGTRGCYGLLTTAQNEVAARVVPARTVDTTRATVRPMAPVRLLDTRTSGGRIPAGSTRHVSVAGAAGIPEEGVTMVALTVTALNAATAGWADIRPCAAGYNATSAINFAANAVVSGSGAYSPDAQGELCVQVSTAVDIVLDLTSWMPSTDLARFRQPYRIADTRTGLGGVARGALGLSPTRRVHTGLSPGSAAVVAVTQVQGTSGGWLAATRCDAPFAGTSTSNAAAGAVREAMAVVVVDGGGDICLVANKAAHAVVDLLGVVRPDGGVVQSNRRLVDTRATRARLAAQQTLRVPVRGGHLFTVTAVAPSGKGWLAVFPCGGSTNGTSTVSFNGAEPATSGSVLVSVTTDLCVKASTATDVLVDDVATFP